MAIAFGQIESIKAFLWWQRRDSQVAKSDRPNCFCSDCGSSWLGGVVDVQAQSNQPETKVMTLLPHVSSQQLDRITGAESKQAISS